MVRVLRSLAAGFVGGALVFLMVAPAGAQTTSACSQIEATLSSIQKQLPQASSSSLASKLGGFATQLESEAAGASPSVKSAVGAFVGDLKAAASGNINVAKLSADANAIGSACTSSAAVPAPSGAPQTGAGTTAGFQDAGLLYGGASAMVVGGGLVAFGWRRRRRAQATS